MRSAVSKQEQATLNLGEPPKSYKSAEAMKNWRDRELAKVLAAPEDRLLLGDVAEVCLLPVRQDSDLSVEYGEPITDPIQVANMAATLLFHRCVIVGYKANSRLPALAAWMLKRHKLHLPIEVWRPRTTFAFGSTQSVVDTVSVLLKSGRTENERDTFAKLAGLQELGNSAADAAMSAAIFLHRFNIPFMIQQWVAEEE